MKTEELVAALRKDCRDCGSNSLCLNGEMNVYCAVRDAADRLEEYVDRCARFSEEIMGLRERGRWIPVEERLPEGDDCVAVCVSGKPQTNITLQNAVELATFSGKEGWILECWPEWESADVTHWMPLPPAPEEVTE